jgi:multiple sugar transport system permease protein
MNEKVKWFPTISLAIITLIILIPIIWSFSISLRPSSETFVPTLIPNKMTLESYTNILENAKYRVWMLNSIIISTSATLIALILGTLAAYGLSRFKNRLGVYVKLYVLSSKMIPPILLSITYFIIIQSLGIYDTLTAVILMDAAAVLPFVVLMMSSFLDSIPREIDEAGFMDGCSKIRVLFRLIIPNSLSQLIATGTLCFLLCWNEYLFALVFTGSESKRAFTVGITSFIGQWWTNYPALMAGALIATAPIVIIFLSLQRYIVNSMVQSMFK